MQNSTDDATMGATPPVAPPCAMVIFGAGGDLTKRLVTPALYNLVTAKRLPDGFRLVGIDHGERSGRGMAQEPHRHDERFRQEPWWRIPRRPHRPDGLEMADRPHELPAGRLHRPADLRPAARASRGPRQERRDRRQPSLLSRRRRPLFRRRRGQARPGGHGDGEGRPMAPRHHRKAVRPRSGIGQGAQRRSCRRCWRAADLPDRPFSRQGDGPEHHGVPLRQRHLRAAVEPRPHRPCPDHRRRDGRRRGPRRLLRADRRAARHGAQPYVPAAVASSAMEPPISFDADALCAARRSKVLEADPAARRRPGADRCGPRPVRRRHASTDKPV